MNKVVLVGRLTKDPEVRYSQGDNANTVANYTVAVERRFKSKKEGEPTADFINCVIWGKDAEFAERYFTKGMRVALSGRLQTRNYTNKEGVKVFVTEVIVEEQEFAQSKGENMGNGSFEQPAPTDDTGDGFMNVPDGIDELPFN